MRNQLRFIIILLIVLGFSLVGLTRLRFETDVLEVLPKNLNSIEALKISQKYFENDQQVVLLLESRSEEINEEDVSALAALLREKLAPSKVFYKSELEESPRTSAHALAELWRNAPPGDVKIMADRLLNTEALVDHISRVKNDIGRSFDQQHSMMTSYDPLGFLEHPAVRQFINNEFSFQSEDRKSHLILISNSKLGKGYKEQAAWIQKIRDTAQSWPGFKSSGLSFRLTGGPAFNAEIGSGMEKDMSGTIMLTSSLIMLLFLVIQRQLSQLLLTILLLGLTFLITLGIGGWIYGTLNLVSVGFASILLGLAIDYPVVIARQSAGGTLSARTLMREVAPGVLWAAVTTIIVFGALSLSNFTGVRQLGGLISIGLIVGAVLMLIFTPLFLVRFPCRNPQQFLKFNFPSSKVAAVVVVTCLLISTVSFAVKGFPKISFDFLTIEPRFSEAAASFELIQKNYPAWSERSFQVIASARSWEDLRGVAEFAQQKLRTARENGVISHYQWPIDLIPNSLSKNANRKNLGEIAGSQKQIIETLKAHGFSESGVALDSMVLESLAGPAEEKKMGDLSRRFLAASDDGHFYLMGSIKTVNEITGKNISDLAPLLSEKFTVTGWPILKSELLPLIKRDFYWIFLPTAALLLLSLIVVFRCLKDAAIAATLLITAVVLLNAFAVLTGQTWNFLSGTAILLIFGSSVDNSIHLIFSLRRLDGDIDKVWNSTGKAVCFCGLSTAIGFSSLIFASNTMLRSMGLLCSTGALLTMILSLVVVPGLWKWGNR